MHLRQVASLWPGGWQVQIQGGGVQGQDVRTVGWGGRLA